MIEGLPPEKFGLGLGLHRVMGAAERLGVDLAGFAARSVVVTGSNGKGSTAAMTAAALRAGLPRVGLFTSPHLLDVAERFQIDARPIGHDALREYSRRVAEAAADWGATREGERMGAFEHLFLIAALWFQDQGCAALVWEAGIGGRYDPVRLVQAKRGALVALDLEHTELLGATLELIACDKLDAFAYGAQVYLGPDALPLHERLAAFAALRGLQLTLLKPGVNWRPAAVLGLSEVDLPVGVARFRSPLPGEHQAANAAIAARLAFDMLQEKRPEGEPEQIAALIAAGLAATRWPGRLEAIYEDPPVLIDVGHTPRAAQVAHAGFRAVYPGPATLVIGVSAGKNAAQIISALAPGFARIIAVAARCRARPAREIASLARAAARETQIFEARSVEEGVSQARAFGAPVLVAGGLFVAAEAKAHATGADPAQLWFL